MSTTTPTTNLDNDTKRELYYPHPDEMALSKLDHVLDVSAKNDLHKDYLTPTTKDDDTKKSATEKDKLNPTVEEDADSEWEKEGVVQDEREKATNWLATGVIAIQMALKWIYRTLNKLTRGHFLALVFLVAYIAYFIAAMRYKFCDEGSHRLLGCTIVGVLFLIAPYVKRLVVKLAVRSYGSEHLTPEHTQMAIKARFFIRWILYFVLLIIIIWTLVEEGRSKLKNLRVLPGIFIFLLIPLLISKNPGKINWHTVYWGMGLQFLFALFAIKWTTGRKCVQWLQDRFQEFFDNSQEGSRFLFGESYRDHYTIFGVVPIFFYVNATLTVLYYLGVIEYLVNFVGKVLNFILSTSPMESVSVAVGIYLEGITTILVLRPFLMSLSKSEMFLLVTSCYASLGGAYLAMLSVLYVKMEYLIPAMLVSAPACIAISKMIVPETREILAGEDRAVEVFKKEREKYKNVMDAAMTGAISMLSVCAEVCVAIFTFYSYISFVNHTLSWFGDRVGVKKKLSIEYIASYLLYPVAILMGVDPEDCRNVAMLLGYRIGIYNIFAFFKLAELKGNRMYYQAYMAATNFTGPVLDQDDDKILVYWNQTLKDGFINERSEAIITYSLCGFSSFINVMMVSSIMFTLIPKRKKWLTRMIVPSLLAGNLANCLTGCFASLFF